MAAGDSDRRTNACSLACGLAVVLLKEISGARIFPEELIFSVLTYFYTALSKMYTSSIFLKL